MRRCGRRPSLRREDGGQVLALFAGSLAALLMVAAFTIDAGYAWWAKRALQAGADAAALAGAAKLPDGPSAIAEAMLYSGDKDEALAKNKSVPETDAVATPECVGSCAAGQYNRIRVVQTANIKTFFWRVLGKDDYDVSARAVASRTSTVSGTPLAVYVHELCGASTGNKGLIAGGDNMRVEGGLHVNGQFKVGNPGFEAVGPATVYRPSAGSPSGPAQGSCTGAAPLRIEDQPDSTYCTGCDGGAVSNPAPGAWRDWVTPYHTEADMKAAAPCTINHTSDVKYENEVIPSGVHCVPNNKKFTVAGTASGNITVIAGMIEVGGTGTLAPNKANVLFYSTNTSKVEVKLNPSAAYDWSGYIINRFGGIAINAAGVTSPQDGLLEAEWIEINGANFTMLGTFTDSSSGGQWGAPALEE